jgi:hypothetical protein
LCVKDSKLGRDGGRSELCRREGKEEGDESSNH